MMDTTHHLTRHLSDQIMTQWPNGPGCLIIGVSGGADSVCLLHLLSNLSAKIGFRLHAGHVHHGIRGEDADADMAFVSDLCRQMNVPFEGMRVDAPAMAKSGKISLEDAARRLRHSAMKDAADRVDADAVVLAHHRDDQAETVLMHLLRGAAAEGLCGMHPFRDGLFRPLLSRSGAELRTCLAENGWEWREDASNRDESYRRNALRHHWIPLLRDQLGQDPTGPLVRFAAIQRQEQEFLSGLACEAADKVGLAGGHDLTGGAQPKGIGVRFESKTLGSLPEVLARRIIFLAWKRATGNRKDLETVHAEAVLKLCRTGRRGNSITLPGRMEAQLDGEYCRIKPVCLEPAMSQKPVEMSQTSVEMNMEPNAKPCGHGEKQKQGILWERRLDWPETTGETRRTFVPEAAGSFRITRMSLTDARAAFGTALRGKETERSQLIDSSQAIKGIYVRNRRPGDTFRPWNGPGSQKLKDWFINRKIPFSERDAIPLLASGKQILWVVGQRTAQELGGTGQEEVLYEMTWDPDAADDMGSRTGR